MSFQRLILFVICVIFTQTTLAHKLNLFTYAEGKQVFVEGYFADGKKAKNSLVKVFNTKREIIIEGTTNDEGEFNFSPTEVGNLRIVLDAGMGHITEYLFSNAELTVPSDTAAMKTNQTTEQSPAQLATMVGQQEIKIIVEQAVLNAVKPLAKELSELKNKTSLSDIIGGIGFILGALGLFAYVKARKA